MLHGIRYFIFTGSIVKTWLWHRDRWKEELKQKQPGPIYRWLAVSRDTDLLVQLVSAVAIDALIWVHTP